MYKRTKTISLMAAALPAMLAMNAEAHYMYANGRWYYHSVGCQAEIESMDAAPASVKCVVIAELVETLCQYPGGLAYPVSLPLQVSLDAQALIEPDSEGRATVEVVIPDAPLLDVVLNLDPSPCGASSTPVAVLIRNMASTVSVSKCVGSVLSPCSVRLLTSTATASCALPAEYTFASLPPPGTWFSCPNPVIVHVF
ncbi:MAG: hypothetical protein M3Z21_00575 [Pseudomonadota bacterium]|nr:hypothetical protein [Pseudomonadota bacterium]